MTIRLLIAPVLLLVACGRAPAPPAPKAEEPQTAAAPQAPPVAISEEEARESSGAAEVLRAYYGLVESKDYEGAARLRSSGVADARRLADNMKAYAGYRVLVGTPGRPARGGDWLYVRVPVMITGSYPGGRGFGSTGSVTLRRSVGAGAPSADRRWRVYTG